MKNLEGRNFYSGLVFKMDFTALRAIPFGRGSLCEAFSGCGRKSGCQAEALVKAGRRPYSGKFRLRRRDWKRGSERRLFALLAKARTFAFASGSRC